MFKETPEYMASRVAELSAAAPISSAVAAAPRRRILPRWLGRLRSGWSRSDELFESRLLWGTAPRRGALRATVPLRRPALLYFPNPKNNPHSCYALNFAFIWKACIENEE